MPDRMYIKMLSAPHCALHHKVLVSDAIHTLQVQGPWMGNGLGRLLNALLICRTVLFLGGAWKSKAKEVGKDNEEGCVWKKKRTEESRDDSTDDSLNSSSSSWL